MTTTCGTIPTSSSPPTNLIGAYGSLIRDCRPWKLMFNFRTFSLPKSFSDAKWRVKTNLVYFGKNYFLVLQLFLWVSLLWNPISHIVFDALAADWVLLSIHITFDALAANWFLLHFLRYDESLFFVVFGRVISHYRLRLVLGAIPTFVILLLTITCLNLNIFTALFLLIGDILRIYLIAVVRAVLVLVHATIRNTDDLLLDDDEEQGLTAS